MRGRASHATSVVVSTYDEGRWNELTACLRSLDEQRRPPLEKIVVVDHNPRLLERVAAEFPDFTVVENDRSRGLAGARNAGVALAGGDLVAFIDDDARAVEDWLERIEECFYEPDVVGIGGALKPRWEDGEAAWMPLEFYWVFGCSYAGLPESVAPIRNPIGANMAVRIAMLREVGGFREGSGGDDPKDIRSRGVVRAAGNVPDDTDFAIRVSQRFPEAIWLYQPEAVVQHTVTRERTSLDYFLRRCYEEGVGKANLSRQVGADHGLRSERRYLASVLPRGVAREFRTLIRGDRSAGLRIAAIVVGLIASATGFATATIGASLERRRARG